MKWILLLALVAGTAHAESPDRSNPFADPGAGLETGDAASAAHSTGFQLKAVMPSGALPLANIDGEILAVGETYKGYLLAEVHDTGVRLERGATVVELLLSAVREDGHSD